MIRKATTADLPALVSIYNQAISSQRCTGHMNRFRVEERLPWFWEHMDRRTPIYVFETEHGVIAYCSISFYRPGRQAFDRVGEISYYVDFDHHGKGIGSRLLEHLLREAVKLEYSHLIAILFDGNRSSISLLKKYGFEQWGVMPHLARIDSHVYSHLYYGLSLEKTV